MGETTTRILVVAVSLAVLGCAGGTMDTPSTTPSPVTIPTPTGDPTPTARAPAPDQSTTPVEPASSTPATSPEPATSSSATSSPAMSSGVGDLEVLAGQFTAFIGAGAPGDCDDSLWDRPIEQLPYAGLPDHRDQAVLGSVATLCLVGFDLDREVELAIALPDGQFRVVSVVLTGDGRPVDLLGGPDVVAGFGTQLVSTTEGSVTWWIRPDAQVGTHGIVAVQEPLVAAGSFDVVVGTEPWLAPLPTDDRAQRRYAASGFPPGPAAFGIYRDTLVFDDDADDGGTVFELVADLGVREFDGSGAAVIEVPVAGLATGEWHCVHSPVLAEPCAGGEGFVDPEYAPWE